MRGMELISKMVMVVMSVLMEMPPYVKEEW
jgi:hypothetical protein